MLQAAQPDQVRPNFKPERSITQRMADDMVDLAAEGDCTPDRLRQRGWTAFDIENHGPKAKEIAGSLLVRRRDQYTYDRAGRIAEAARHIAGLMPATIEICTTLQTRSFTKPELDDILPDAIAKAADDFAHKCGGAGEGRAATDGGKQNATGAQ